MKEERAAGQWSAACAALACLVATASSGASAAPSSVASDPVRGLLACRRISAASARLECFDRESAALAGASRTRARTPSAAVPAATAVAPAAVGARSAATVLDPQTTFGLSEGKILAREVASGARPAELSHITTRIAGLGTAADGRILFRLDNGEVWRELVNDGELLAKVGDSVTVSRGVLGSYYMRLPNGRGCKVTRLR